MDLSGGAPSLLVPIFSYSRSNVPYVQSMDEFLLIRSFSPFYDAEEFELISMSSELSVDVDQPGIIAFRENCGRIFAGNIESVFSYYEEHLNHDGGSPLLRMQIGRLVEESRAKQYDLIKAVGVSFFRSEKQKEFWVDSGLMILQKEKSFWDVINQSRDKKKKLKIEPIKSHWDREQLIAALSQSRYYSYSNWSNLWFSLLRIAPNDERVLEVAKKWLYSQVSGDSAPSGARDVLCAVIDLSHFSAAYDDSLYEFLSDIVSSHHIFSDELRVPFRILRKILDFIGDRAQFMEHAELIYNLIAESFYFGDQLEAMLDMLIQAIRYANIPIDSRIMNTSLLYRLEAYAINPAIVARLRELRKLLPPPNN
jgi:hypothetical protein